MKRLKKKLSESQSAPQAKSPQPTRVGRTVWKDGHWQCNDSFSFVDIEPHQIPAFIRKSDDNAWVVAVDWDFVVRNLTSLARMAAKGVTAAERALDDIEDRMMKIREVPIKPGSLLFETKGQWTEVLDQKMAEWALQNRAPSGTRLLLEGLRVAIRAAVRGEADAEKALDGVYRKLQKLAAQESRTIPEKSKSEAPSPDQLQAWFDLPSDPPQADGPESIN